MKRQYPIPPSDRDDFGAELLEALSGRDESVLVSDLIRAATKGPFVVETRMVTPPGDEDLPNPAQDKVLVWWPLASERPSDEDVVRRVWESYDPREG